MEEVPTFQPCPPPLQTTLRVGSPFEPLLQMQQGLDAAEQPVHGEAAHPRLFIAHGGGRRAGSGAQQRQHSHSQVQGHLGAAAEWDQVPTPIHILPANPSGIL